MRVDGGGSPQFLRVSVPGQLTAGNRQELQQKVVDELERGERKFLIDFSDTGYVDTSGLGVLVSLSKKVRDRGGELRLVNLNDDLTTLLELTRLDALFRIGDGGEGAGSAAPLSRRPPGPLRGAAAAEPPVP